jgi:8-oxo-dGTP diphosphatase
MIEKKQGLGTGLINAPGGHIEEEETAQEAAIREMKEETGLSVSGLSLRGELRFQFKDGMGERAYVFFADSHSGELKECDETRPFWIKKADFPFDKMWEDDKLWLPVALEGKHFLGSFIFDGQKMLDHNLITTDET